MIEPSRFISVNGPTRPLSVAVSNSIIQIDHPPEPGKALPGVRTRRVLVASPDESFLRLATYTLSSFRPGHNVATASSLALAMDWLPTFKPVLVIVDLDLLGPDDYVSDLAPSHVKVIVVAPGGQDPLWVPSEVDFSTLTKPVTLPVLLEAVRQVDFDD